MCCKKEEENENKIKEIITLSRLSNNNNSLTTATTKKGMIKEYQTSFIFLFSFFIQQAGVPTLCGPPGVLED